MDLKMSFCQRKAISSLEIKVFDLVKNGYVEVKGSDVCLKNVGFGLLQADVMVTSGLALGIGTHAGMVEVIQRSIPTVKLWGKTIEYCAGKVLSGYCLVT